MQLSSPFKFIDILDLTRSAIFKVLQENFGPLIDHSKFVVDFSEHADVYTNIALIVAKLLKNNPIKIAEIIARALEKDLAEIIDQDGIKVAGPGFINLNFKPKYWSSLLIELNASGVRYPDLGLGQTINLEFVSANPTGPLHVGHARGAVIGSTLANVLSKTGFRVTREYYINDAGSQIDKLLESVILRYKQVIKILPEDIAIPEGMYPGEYLIEVAHYLFGIFPTLENLENNITKVRELVIDQMMLLIRRELGHLRVEHDSFVKESSLYQEVDEVISKLKDQDLVYEGVPPPPKEFTKDWVARKQLLFRASLFGDDCDRPLQKADGSWTYFASDIIYHFYKVNRGFDSLVMILGADHDGYVSRIKGVVSALTNGKKDLIVKLYNLVNFLKSGQPLKMSKRGGNFITIEEVVKEVGGDAVRFMLLLKSSETILDFDLEKAKEQSNNNPVFYVQYAHTRVQSLIRRLNNTNLCSATLNEEEYILIKEEIEAVKLAIKFTSVLKGVVTSYEPHRLAHYLISVAEKLHHLWNMPGYRFIVDTNLALTKCRMALAGVLGQVLANGLNLFNITPLDEM